MVDLYEILGVKKNATLQTIRKSYRRLAKKAHPDTGGSPEVFAQLKKAHDILADPERRAKYDATGDMSEKAIDNSLAQVIALLASALENVLTQIENRRGEPTEFELVNDMKILLGSELDKVQMRIKDLKRQQEKTKKLLGRFGVKDGENYLEGIIIGKLSALETTLRLTEEGEKPIKKALDILTNSSFKSDYGGARDTHHYGARGPSAYRLQDLMNIAMGG